MTVDGRRNRRRIRGSADRWMRVCSVAAVLAVPPLLTQTYPGAGFGGSPSSSVLTPDGTDAYTYETSDGGVEAAALASDSSENLRTVFWPAPAFGGWPGDQQSCATFSSATTWHAQEGLALRINRTPNGGVRAITVTKNVWFGATWLFNVHRWDGTPTLHPLATIDLASVFRQPDGTPQPFPWTVCARIIGARITVKGWLAGSGEPEWGDENFSGTRTIAVQPTARGLAGWYVGHIPPGGAAEFTDLRTWAVDPTGGAPSPATTLQALGSPTPSASAAITVRGPTIAPPVTAVDGLR